MGVVTIDWRGACIAPMYKWRVTSVNVVTREVFVCYTSRVTTFTQCIVAYGIVLIKRGPKLNLQLEVFAVRLVREKYLATGIDVFWAFMDWEKTYDTIVGHGMLQILKVYGCGSEN